MSADWRLGDNGWRGTLLRSLLAGATVLILSYLVWER